MTKTYNTYKDSGIAWIGNIPSEWKVLPIKAALSRKSEKGHGEAMVLSLYRDLGIVPKDSRDDNHNVTSEKTDEYRYVEKGDFVINKMKAWQGSMALSNYSGIVSPAYYVCSFKNEDIYKPYFHYLLRNDSYLPEYRRLSAGLRVGQWDLGFDDFKSIPFLQPSLSEQQAIATYLDKKCGEIDSLISLQEEMISELQAYKQSVITEAVTKGLNPNVPMKDSGVEWIGMIPEGWNICKLKFLCSSIKDGSHFSPTTTEEGFPYITAADVHGKGLDYANAKKISEKDYNDLVQSGCKAEKDDILLVKDGATTGRVGMKIENNPCVLLSSVAMLRVNTKSYPTYLMYMVSSDLLQQQISIAMAGSAMPRITLTKLNTFIALEVPLSEQQAIASYLDEKTSQIDSLIAIKQEKITELKDYKKSIIYEYVTGKKKV